MMGERPPWMTPVIYNDDRWASPKDPENLAGRTAAGKMFPENEDLDERDGHDVQELLSRPDEREEKHYECTDKTPINYSKGPHDQEFGVDEDEFDKADPDPVNYSRAPHDDEFGVDEDDENNFQQADDDESEFDGV